MNWAARRRFIILFIFGAIAATFLAIVLISAFYRTPSCTDEIQNQDEAGVDCGGPCKYLCLEQMQPPTVLFTKVIRNVDGRTDIVAEVENKNMDAAAKNVSYKIALYGEEGEFLQELSGVLDLPPRTSSVIYLPGVTAEEQEIANAFLEISASEPKWFSMSSNSRVVPLISNIIQKGTKESPKIEAVLSNPSMVVLSNIQVVVLVHNAEGDVIAASKTIIPSIQIKDKVTATFTWNSAFPSPSARIEIIPIIPLP